jgi:hypothetical protein
MQTKADYRRQINSAGTHKLSEKQPPSKHPACVRNQNSEVEVEIKQTHLINQLQRCLARFAPVDTRFPNSRRSNN